MKRAAIAAAAALAAAGITTVAVLSVRANRIERDAAQRFQEELRVADSLIAVPREWPPFTSVELGKVTAQLRTTCLGSGSPGAPRRLHYQLRLEGANRSLLDPIREPEEIDEALARFAASASRRSTGDSGARSADRELGMSSPTAAREALAVRKQLQRAHEGQIRARFVDTVMVVSLHDSAGFRRLDFPVFRNVFDPPFDGGPAVLVASDSTAQWCASTMRDLTTWRLSRARRPPI